MGNWVADEVLYQARIHPERPCNSLRMEEIEELHKQLVGVIRTACDADADKNEFPEEWLFNYRWTKKQATRDHFGNAVSFCTVGSRTSAVVAALQKMGGYGDTPNPHTKASPRKKRAPGGRKAKEAEEAASDGGSDGGSDSISGATDGGGAVGPPAPQSEPAAPGEGAGAGYVEELHRAYAEVGARMAAEGDAAFFEHVLRHAEERWFRGGGGSPAAGGGDGGGAGGAEGDEAGGRAGKARAGKGGAPAKDEGGAAGEPARAVKRPRRV